MLQMKQPKCEGHDKKSATQVTEIIVCAATAVIVFVFIFRDRFPSHRLKQKQTYDTSPLFQTNHVSDISIYTCMTGN